MRSFLTRLSPALLIVLLLVSTVVPNVQAQYGGSCQPTYTGACSTDSDCCSGWCSFGTCADPGGGGGSFNITGTVFVDTNRNKVWDSGETAYTGANAVLNFVGYSNTTTTAANGTYSFNGITGGNYQIQLVPPTGYGVTTLNPYTVSPTSSVANFGIAESYTISGHAYYDDNGNQQQDCVGSCNNGTGDEKNFQGITFKRTGTAANSIATSSANGNFTFYDLLPRSYTVTMTVPPNYSVTTANNPKTVTLGPNATINYGLRQTSCIPGGATLSGTVYVDGSNGACGSSLTTIGSGATVTVRTSSGGAVTATGSTNSSGQYTINDNTACGQKSVSLSNVALNYTSAKCVRLDGGAWTSTGLTGFTYNPLNFSSNHTLDWYLSSSVPWFQTGDGDVRFGNLVDSLPSASAVSSNANSAFFSSAFIPTFGAGNPVGFVISNEYSYNADPETKNGLFSYSFFINRAKVKSVTVTNLVGTPGVTNCTGATCDISNLPTGIYKYDGDLTLTSYTHLDGAHVLLLVNGNLLIKTTGNIKVAAGRKNLFIIAAKKDINIDPSVGAAAPAAPCGTNACTNLEGIYTAEGSINLQGTKCSDNVTPDKQFTLAGSFVTNALKPLKVGGAGIFNNNRSLCGGDQTYPVFVTQSRYDFVPQLTDFYKIPAVRWKEVNP
ncbi:MAG TPA: SdrD B-like domain-containing protein [Patescibacteria group bacterium]|nr:SdrD B-like domain-containing protein [Patescibacteria group bacterium]